MPKCFKCKANLLKNTYEKDKFYCIQCGQAGTLKEMKEYVDNFNRANKNFEPSKVTRYKNMGKNLLSNK